MKLMKILESNKFSNQDTADVYSTLSDDFLIVSKINQLNPMKLEKIWKRFFRSRVYDYIDTTKVDWKEVLIKLQEENV